jgi:hypothetical protein
MPHRSASTWAFRPSLVPEKGGTGIAPERGGTGLFRHHRASRFLLLLTALGAAGVEAREHSRVAGELSGAALLNQRADGAIEMSFLLATGPHEDILLVARGMRDGEDAWLEVSRPHARGAARVGEMRLLFAGCAADGMLSIDLDALIKAEHGGTGKPGEEEDPEALDGVCVPALAKAEHGGTGKPGGGDDDPDADCATPLVKAEHGGTGNPPPPGGKQGQLLELVFALATPDPACGTALAARTP